MNYTLVLFLITDFDSMIIISVCYHLLPNDLRLYCPHEVIFPFLHCCEVAFYGSFNYRQNYRHLLRRDKGIFYNQIKYFLLSFSQLNCRHTADILPTLLTTSHVISVIRLNPL